MSSVKQASFASGEIAPALYARTDQSKYSTALRTCRNNIVMRQGGVTNRPGTLYVGPVKDSTKTVRLIPFIFNEDDTYVLEFGDEYVRFIRNGAYVFNSAQSIVDITSANPGVVTYSGADTYANGDIVYISGCIGTLGFYVNNRFFKVAAVDAALNTFQLNNLDGTAVNTSATAYAPLIASGAVQEVYTLVSPYDYLDLPNLRFTQSGDVITITHPSYAVRTLTRSSSTSWAFASTTFAPSLATPSAPTGGPGAGTAASWVVTTVSNETGEESLPSAALTSSAAPTSASPITITFAAYSGAPAFPGIVVSSIHYNVYRAKNGIYGFVGSAASGSFIDIGTDPDIEDNPPEARNPFSSANNYPSCVAYHQQRILYAKSNNYPETSWASRVGLYPNFTLSTPAQDDQAVTFTLFSRHVNEIRHLLDLARLIVFTSGGEWILEGDGNSGSLTPTAINPRQFSANGCSDLAPLVVNDTALYVQASRSTVRDLGFDFEVDGYRGNEISIFASHLFDGKTVVDWAYQKVPYSVVWIVLSDGSVVGLTYIREQQMIAWHRHDFQDDIVENVCSVPEGTASAVYFVIKRTVNGATVRYVEKLTPRIFSDINDAVFMDCAATFDGSNSDGYNANAATMTLSGGTTWDAGEEITLTGSIAVFYSTDVGNEFWLTGSDGTVIKFRITSYTSTTVVKGQVDKLVPVAMRSVSTLVWAKAVTLISGLFHIEGEEVSIFANGSVLGNPNNSEIAQTYTVTNGQVTLSQPQSIVSIGLPYISDIETLDIDTAGGESIADKKKLISRVSVFVQDTRGVWVGAKPPTDDDDDPLENLDELKVRDQEDYATTEMKTANVDVDIRAEWNGNGRVFIRQIDPVPASILSIVPTGLIPYPSNGG